MVEHGMSVRRACRVARLPQRSWYRQPADALAGDAEVIAALQAIVARHGRWGFWKCFRRLRLDGHPWNHKRVWRVYCQLKLNLPRRTKKRLPRRERQTLEVPMQANALWSMDFMADTLYGGRRFRTLNVLDEGVREALAIEIDTSLRAERVVRVLEQLKDWRGLPRAIRCDNGPEYTAQPVVDWCRDHGIELRYIQPGKPNQNAYYRTLQQDLPHRGARRPSVRGSGSGSGDHRHLATTLQQRTPARVAREPAAEPLSPTMRAGNLSL